MVARIISAARPRLIAAVLASREFEIRRPDPRSDLIEFVTFALLAEICGQHLAHGPAREPLLILLAAMSDRYDHPRVLRDLAALAREGAPL